MSVPAASLEEDAEAELRWRDLDDIGLDAKILALRDDLRDTSERLLSLGVTPEWEADQTQATALRDGTGEGGPEIDDGGIRYGVTTPKGTALWHRKLAHTPCPDLQTRLCR